MGGNVLRGVRRAGAVTALMGCLGVGGCGFFVDESSTSSSSSTSNTGNYVYVANQTTDTLTGYVVGSSALTAVSGSPYTLVSGLTPASVAVSRANTFVYVGGIGAIESYSIGSGGALTLVSSGAAVASGDFVSLETSPDGNWLLALDGYSENVYIFAINPSTGALTLNTTVPYAAPGTGTVTPRQVHISPNGDYAIANLGAGGDVVFTFNTSSGVLTSTGTLAVASGYSDNSSVYDPTSGFLYIARQGTNTGTSLVAGYSVSSSAGLTQVGTATTGNTPYAALLDSTGAYLYTANRGDGTVSGFSVASGKPTALSGSPFASGTLTTALAEDNGKAYVIAASYGGSSDLTMYSLASGVLTKVAVNASGTDPAGSVAIAATH